MNEINQKLLKACRAALHFIEKGIEPRMLDAWPALSHPLEQTRNELKEAIDVANPIEITFGWFNASIRLPLQTGNYLIVQADGRIIQAVYDVSKEAFYSAGSPIRARYWAHIPRQRPFYERDQPNA